MLELASTSARARIVKGAVFLGSSALLHGSVVLTCPSSLPAAPRVAANRGAIDVDLVDLRDAPDEAAERVAVAAAPRSPAPLPRRSARPTARAARRTPRHGVPSIPVAAGTALDTEGDALPADEDAANALAAENAAAEQRGADGAGALGAENRRVPSARARTRSVGWSAPIPSSANGPPDYPPLARELGLEAEVIARLIVREDGTVAEVRIVHGAALFDREVLRTLRTWEYRPATRDGKPTATAWTVRIPFTLQ